MPNLKKKIILIGISFLFIFASNSQAGNYIAVLQISAPTGLTEMIFQTNCKSKKLCELLNKNFWKGVRTSNPWTKDYEGCLSSMPRGFEPVLYNQPIQFPYLTSEKDRIVVFGLPLNESIEVCKALSKIYRNQLKRPAKCIMPEKY